MKPPTHWTEAERDEYEERAAIIEYDGDIPRDRAERMAAERIETKRARKNQPSRQRSLL